MNKWAPHPSLLVPSNSFFVWFLSFCIRWHTCSCHTGWEFLEKVPSLHFRDLVAVLFLIDDLLPPSCDVLPFTLCGTHANLIWNKSRQLYCFDFLSDLYCFGPCEIRGLYLSDYISRVRGYRRKLYDPRRPDSDTEDVATTGRHRENSFSALLVIVLASFPVTLTNWKLTPANLNSRKVHMPVWSSH